MKINKYEGVNPLQTTDNDLDIIPPTQDQSYNDLYQDNGWSGEGMLAVDKHTDLLKDLTDFDPFLKTLVSEWLGLYWNSEQDKYVKDDNVDPIMNIKGARWAINFLRVYARKNNIITNLGRDEFNNIMQDVIETVELNMGTRAEYFGITTNGDILLVTNQLIHATELILLGASGTRTYNDLLGNTVNRNESINLAGNNQNQSNQSQGWLERARNVFR